MEFDVKWLDSEAARKILVWDLHLIFCFNIFQLNFQPLLSLIILSLTLCLLEYRNYFYEVGGPSFLVTA